MKKDIQPEEKTSSAEISAANNKATDTDADAGALCVSDAPVGTVKSDPDRVSAISEKAKKYGFFDYCPIPAFVLLCLAVFAAGIHAACVMSVSFSDLMNRSVSHAIRLVLAEITDILPFSLAETVLLCIPVIAAVLVVYSLKVSRDANMRRTVRLLTSTLAAAALLYSMFALEFAPAYNGSTIEDRLGIDRREVSAEELYNTALLLSERLGQEADNISFISGESSVMPYSLSEMNKKLSDAYASACEKYTFVPEMNTRVKPLAISGIMTYTHISGVYTFYTGESNINTNYPDYIIPYTAAHELSHQRGIAREDEANFMAFLVCMESDDTYIRYSGLANMFEYVSGALYKADRSLYYNVLSEIDMRVYGELYSYSVFFEKYSESVASKVSDAVNDTFLKSQGQKEGTASYGRVVDLAVAYLLRSDE